MVDTYPHPSLRFVAFEVRFPPVPDFSDEPSLRALHDGLRHDYPYRESFSVVTSVEMDPGGVRQDVSARNRFVSRTRTSAITLAEDLLIFEAGSYDSFEVFTATVKRALTAVAAVGQIAGFERVGIRYVNEIRVDPPPDAPRGWKSYIVPELVSPVCLLRDSAPEVFEGALIYPRGGDLHVVFRFGARVGRMVNPTGPLRVADKGAGPYFLLDIDSYWEHLPEVLPDFEVDAILDCSVRLHEAAQDVFEASITDRLRTEVFGADGNITR